MHRAAPLCCRCWKVRSSFVDPAVVERGVDGAVVNEDQVDPSVGVGLRCEEGFVDDAVGVVARGVVPRGRRCIGHRAWCLGIRRGCSGGGGLVPRRRLQGDLSDGRACDGR